MAETSSAEPEIQNLQGANALKLFLQHDPTAFLTHLNHLFGKDTNLRSNALALYDYTKKNYPDSYALRCIKIIRLSHYHTTRKNCAVLLQRLFSTPHSILGSLFSITLPNFLTDLLDVFRKETAQEILEIIGTVLALIAQDLLPKNSWDELYCFMFEGLSSDMSDLKLRSLILFAKIIPMCPRLFTPRVDELYNSFTTLIDTDKSTHEVVVAAVQASVMMVLYLTTPSNHDKYHKLVLCTGKAMFELSDEEEIHAQKILEEMIILGGIKTGLFKTWIHRVFEIMLEICEEDFCLRKKTRQLAVEFVITVAEDKECGRGIIKTLSDLNERFIKVLIDMLALIKDHPTWDNSENDDANIKSEMYSYAMESIIRFGNALGENSFSLPGNFYSFLDCKDWTKRHAAATIFGLLSQGCPKDMLQNMDSLLPILLKLLKDPHPRVRWQALNVVGEFSINLSSYLQEQCHKELIPALILALNDFDNPRVQTRAALAMQKFSKNCSKQILKPHLKTIVIKLLKFLQKGKQMLKEAALLALGTLAHSSQEEFKECYEDVVSYMNVFFANTSSEEDSNRMLLIKHLDCITMIGLAVGKKMFRSDVQKIVEVIHDEDLTDPDHPERIHVLQMWGRLCKCLGSDFLPFLSIAMPALLYSADIKVDISETQASDSEDEVTESSDPNDVAQNFVDSSDDESVSEVSDEKSNIRTRESLIQEKAVACNILCCIISQLKEELHLWIHEIVKVLVPLIGFTLHDDVRTAAISAMPMMMQISVCAMKKPLLLIGLTEPQFKALSDMILSGLHEALIKEREMEICERILVALKECVEISGSSLDKTQITHLIDGLIEFLEALLYNKRQRDTMVKRGFVDPDTRSKEILKEVRIYAKIADYLGAFIGIYKVLFLPIFDKVLPCIGLMWGNGKSSGERKVVIRIFLDIAEQCGDKAFKYYENILSLVFRACNDENPNVRELIAYAIGVCAQFGGNVFQSHVQDGICSLQCIIEYPTLKSDEMHAHETAISALGKICRFQSLNIENPVVIGAYLLNHLPIGGVVDLNEAKILHEHFCSIVEMGYQNESDPWKLDIQRVIQIFAEIMQTGNKRATPETVERIIKLMKKFHVEFPKFDKICNSLPLPLSSFSEGRSVFADKCGKEALSFHSQSNNLLNSPSRQFCTTLVAVKYQGGIMMGSDRLMTIFEKKRSVCLSESSVKIHKVTEHVFCAMTGDVPALYDIFMVANAEFLLRQDPNKEDIIEFAKLLDEYRRISNQTNTHFLVGGWNTHKKSVILQVPLTTENHNDTTYLCAGSGGLHIFDYLKNKCTENLSEETARIIVLSAVEIGIHSDPQSGGGIVTVMVSDDCPISPALTTSNVLKFSRDILFELDLSSHNRLVQLMSTLTGLGIIQVAFHEMEEFAIGKEVSNLEIRGSVVFEYAKKVQEHAEKSKKLFGITAYDTETIELYDKACEKAFENYTIASTSAIREDANAMLEEPNLTYENELANLSQAKLNKRRGLWVYDRVNYFEYERIAILTKNRQRMEVEAAAQGISNLQIL